MISCLVKGMGEETQLLGVRMLTMNHHVPNASQTWDLCCTYFPPYFLYYLWYHSTHCSVHEDIV